MDTAEELADVLLLDESLWVATSAPVGAFRCDERLTDLLDSDDNGRINTREVKAAVKWLLDVLADRSGLAEGKSAIDLSVINADAQGANALIGSARYVLKELDQESSSTISLELVRSFLSDLQQRPLNGDGVLVTAAAKDAATARFIEDVLTCTGGADDASGEKGITEDHLNQFWDATIDYLDWLHKGEEACRGEENEVMFLGPDTPGIYSVFKANADKVDHFFAMSDALAFLPGTAFRIGCPEAEMESLDFTMTEGVNACMAKEPLARPTEDSRLPLDPGKVNPVYRQWIIDFKSRVLVPVLKDVGAFLDKDAWLEVRSRLAPYEEYIAGKKGACVESLDVDKLREYRDGTFDASARELAESDKQVTYILNGVLELEKLLLYHCYLLRFVDNFVGFGQLYSVDERAMFEMGSAVIDGRWFNLALKVDDLASHSAQARTSNIFTLYLEITGKKDDKVMHVAVPATSGSKGNLCVGKRGIFFDTDGREFDARVVKIIENPISLREALVAPFKRLWNFILGKIEAMSGSYEKDLQKSADAMLQAAPPPAAGSPAAGALAKIPGGPAGLLVGLSVSAAAIGSAFAFITKTMSGMSQGQVVGGLLSAALVVVVPVLLVAILKLRRQDLSSLLEGCGWAINARMRFNRAQRRQFTKRRPFPEGASGTPVGRWVKVVVAMVCVGAVAVLLIAALQRWSKEDGGDDAVPSGEKISALDEAGERDTSGDGSK